MLPKLEEVERAHCDLRARVTELEAHMGEIVKQLGINLGVASRPATPPKRRALAASADDEDQYEPQPQPIPVLNNNNNVYSEEEGEARRSRSSSPPLPTRGRRRSRSPSPAARRRDRQRSPGPRRPRPGVHMRFLNGAERWTRERVEKFARDFGEVQKIKIPEDPKQTWLQIVFRDERACRACLEAADEVMRHFDVEVKRLEDGRGGGGGGNRRR